ncbi:MAG: phosphodiester glycosidase family protein [Clostridia bacterium]|nr:phosphodiester glycosidase family protein [Clostridia bacterium]
MKRNVFKKVLSLTLAIIMLLSVSPTVYAVGSTTNYADFMTNLKVLEGYADEYASGIYGKDPGELVLNFIRTGVERYQDDNWETLAGEENTGFTSFVERKDKDLGTNAMALRDIVINDFKLPNGNKVDFGHMFGCMNISYVAAGSADLSGWAGDICDLLQYSVEQLNRIEGYKEGDVEKMAAYVLEECFGVDASGAFGWDDFWGDMDAYYLVSEYKKANGEVKFSALMEEYFTDDLNDTDRTVYFMNNRFGVADNKEAVRKAIYESYSTDVGIKILESKRGLSSYNALREACCYAVADYIYENAKGMLIEGNHGSEGPVNGYYTVFSNEHSTLAPGITQDINYAQTADGKQIVYYVATVDVNRDDVDLMVNYNNNKAPVGSNIGLQRVEDQVAALVENNKDKENFHPIVATNGAGYNITTGVPSGLVVMNGVEYYPVGAPAFFAILDDGKAVIASKDEYNNYKDRIKEGIQGFGAVLVKDGKINVTKTANYTANRASRTAIGIKADGSVVMMVLDGRQLPFSAGGAMEEIAQIMLDAGCVDAVNLDGGGSTTYMSKPAGSDDIKVVNRPSDGYARSVSTSLVVVSTAAPSTAFDSAIVSSDYDYITVGTSMHFEVTGVSNTGNAAVIPEGSYWKTSDENIGYIDPETGIFTAVANGTVTVQYVVNGEVKGSKEIGVVIPDDVKFTEDHITAIYGVPKEIGISLWYNGFPVAYTMMQDAIIVFYDNNDFVSDAGVIEGSKFIGDESKNVRSVKISAFVIIDDDLIFRVATVNLYKSDEATFDFENATQGNRKLAWNREIENAKTIDNQFYRISDPDSPVVIDYTFALDMASIDFPTQLEPLKSMLPTQMEGATAWTYMLQLAERVCTQTNVTIKAEFSKELDVDISGLKVINEYFKLDSANLDTNNVLTLRCNWVNQSKPIDATTANPLCILSGIKCTVKDTAAWYNNEIMIANNGTVTYEVYLAASSLYSFASNPENQAKYGLKPYIHEEDCRSDFSDAEDDEVGVANNDKGAYFSGQYMDFADIYVLNSEVLQGWQEEGSDYYYYVDNERLTGTQLVADRKDSTKLRFYEFDEEGKLVSEQGVTGLIEFNGDLYYPALGVVRTGWYEIDEKFYYFDINTGKAANGKVTIRENKNSWQTADFEYTFEDNVLVKGVWMNDTQGKYSGWRYRWAGDWIVGEWFEVDGKWYFSNKNEYGYVRTGYQHYIPSKEDTTVNKCYLFDVRGALRTDYNGPAYIESRNEIRYFKAGLLYSSIGFTKADDGFIYHVTYTGVVSVSTEVTVNAAQSHGLVSAGTYAVDKYGRLTKQLVLTDDNAIIDRTNDNVNTEVIGGVLTVENDTSCKVVYKDGDGYESIDSMENPYGDGYNFDVPTDTKEVEIIINGDVNIDGEITNDDVTDLRDEALGKTEDNVTEQGMLVGDVNGDGKITALDLALIAAAANDPNFKLGW